MINNLSASLKLSTVASFLYLLSFGGFIIKCQAFQIVHPSEGTITTQHHLHGLHSFQSKTSPIQIRSIHKPYLNLFRYNHPLPKPQEKGIQTLYVSSTDNDDDSSKRKTNKLSLEYRVATISYMALVALCVPFFLKGRPPSNFPTLVKTMPPFFNLISGQVVAAGISSILPSAVDNNRLKSDTYQRLNWFLVFYATIQLVAVGVDYKNALKNWWPFALAAILGLIPAWKGWNQGITENTAVATWNMGKDTIKGLLGFKTIKGFGYLLALYFMMYLKIDKLWEMKGFIMDGSSYMISRRMFRYSKYALLFGTLFTLKSAADRDRLEGGTFINLNYLCSFFFMALSFATYPPSLSLLNFIVPFSFSLFCAYNGISSKMKKNK